MILYHLLPTNVYHILLQQGYLNGQIENIWCYNDVKDWPNKPLDNTPYFFQAYMWMVDRMEKYLPPKPFHAGQLPMWAWYRRNGPIGKPDLSTIWNISKEDQELFYDNDQVKIEKELIKKRDTVMLTLEIDPKYVLLTDFEAWHFCLNRWYFNGFGIYDSLPEEEMEIRVKNDNNFPREVIWDSWDHPHHLIPRDQYELCKYRIGREIQATFWLLTLNMVKHVDCYKGSIDETS